MIATEILGLLALGVGIGAFGTLIGAGGGFLAVPILIVIYGFEPRVAAGTSLAFVFLNALSGSLAYLKQKRVDVKVGLMFALLTIPSSVLGAYVTSYFESNLFNIMFASLLIATALYLVVKPLKDKHDSRAGSYCRKLIDCQGNVYEYSVNLARGFAVSVGVGFISSVFGIGGGIIHVPAMICILGFPVHISTATSLFILTFCSLVGSATHASLGNVRLEFAMLIGFGAVIGAQLGARVSYKIKGAIIERLLGLALIIVAVRLLLQTP